MGKIQDWSIPEDQQLFRSLPDELKLIVLESSRCKKALETLLEVTDDFIYIKDINHKFIYTSDAFAKLTNHSSWKELVGKDDFDVFPIEHAEVYYQFEESVIQKGHKLNKHEEPYYDLQGNLRWVSSTKNPVFDSQGNVIGLVGISKDITELKLQQEKIKQLAAHDYLTGLHNRRALFELGDLFIQKAKREQQQVAMLFIDLDKFKNVNDRYGHDIGDEVLVRFSEHLSESTRSSDLVVRIGGDEFAICMSGRADIKQSAIKCVERICSVSGSGEIKSCSCSVGIAITDSDYNLLSLLRVADKAMYAAKSSSIDYVCETI
ncbi:sensor domain-containing diguanylate cyclase [Neptuniibacter sp.]|uniref:sensor domain-containing diguanylate cyclase n=1 Tax=Neptuniibacter sp. TaxID=1962643 RepID=UPI00260D24A4|nr:sensor domain-containing diguanylate cyclase [Neptuniibacter sp.]MCP4596657.1 diguanylate cyclase [Neptuniibacter sp.]